MRYVKDQKRGLLVRNFPTTRNCPYKDATMACLMLLVSITHTRNCFPSSYITLLSNCNNTTMPSEGRRSNATTSSSGYEMHSAGSSTPGPSSTSGRSHLTRNSPAYRSLRRQRDSDHRYRYVHDDYEYLAPKIAQSSDEEPYIMLSKRNNRTGRLEQENIYLIDLETDLAKQGAIQEKYGQPELDRLIRTAQGMREETDREVSSPRLRERVQEREGRRQELIRRQQRQERNRERGELKARRRAEKARNSCIVN